MKIIPTRFKNAKSGKLPQLCSYYKNVIKNDDGSDLTFKDQASAELYLQKTTTYLDLITD